MRINVIPVEYLADAHLRAEFREIPLSIHYYKRSLKAGKIDKNRISPVYTLNKGHGYMWYDKFGYIQRRYEELLVEMKLRGFKTDGVEAKFYKLFEEYIPLGNRNDYTPTSKDKQVNLERILTRIKSKEGENFYKYCGENLNFEQWQEVYEGI